MKALRRFKISGIIMVLLVVGLLNLLPSEVAANTVIFPSVGFMMSFAVTQTAPGPTAVTITVTRSTASELLISASTEAISSASCILSLGGSFNVQASLKPKTPAIAGQFIVMQSIQVDPSITVPSYLVADGQGRHTGPSHPLSDIGVSAMYSGAANFAGDCSSGGGAGTPAGVTYHIPFGTGAGQFDAITFLGTQPFGFAFEPPTDLTLIAS